MLNQVAGFTPTPRTNLTLLVEPLAARTLKQREGFDSKKKLARWYHENSTIPAEVYWDYQLVINYIEPQARKGVELYASYLKLSGDAPVPRSPSLKRSAWWWSAARRTHTGLPRISAT